MSADTCFLAALICCVGAGKRGMLWVIGMAFLMLGLSKLMS